MNMWVLAPEEDRLVHRPVEYIPGLFKILDDCLISSVENYHIDRAINTFKFDTIPEKG